MKAREIIQLNAKIAAIYTKIETIWDSGIYYFDIIQIDTLASGPYFIVEPSDNTGLTLIRTTIGECKYKRDKCLRQNNALAALLANEVIEFDSEINDDLILDIIDSTSNEHRIMVGENPHELMNMDRHYKELLRVMSNFEDVSHKKHQ